MADCPLLPPPIPPRRRKDGHQGWALLPLTTNHMPPYSEGGKPASQTSSFTFTIRSAPTVPAPAASGPSAAPSGTQAGMPHPPSPRTSGPSPGLPQPPLMPGAGGPGMNGFAPTGSGLSPLGMNLPGLGGGLGMPGLNNPLQPAAPQQQLPPGYMADPQMAALRLQQQQQQQRGLPVGLPSPLQPGGMFGGQQQPVTAGMQAPQAPQQQQFGGLTGIDLPPGLAGLDPGTLQSLMQMPALDMFNAGAPGLPPASAGLPVGAAPRGGAPPAALQPPAGLAQQRQQQAVGGAPGAPVAGGALPPELANLLKEDSLSPFEDPNFQQLMSMVAANAPPGSGSGSGRGPAPRSGGRDKGGPKRKAGGYWARGLWAGGSARGTG